MDAGREAQHPGLVSQAAETYELPQGRQQPPPREGYGRERAAAGRPQPGSMERAAEDLGMGEGREGPGYEGRGYEGRGYEGAAVPTYMQAAQQQPEHAGCGPAAEQRPGMMQRAGEALGIKEPRQGAGGGAALTSGMAAPLAGAPQSSTCHI